MPLASCPAPSAESLYTGWKDRLVGSLVRQGFDFSHAEEAVQNAFIKFIEVDGTFQSDKQAYVWLRRTAHNMLISQLRREHPSEHLDEEEQELAVGTDVLDEVVLRELASQKQAMIRSLPRRIGNLPPTHQIIINEIYLKGRQQIDVAKDIGMHGGNVSRKRQEILVLLRKRLKKSGYSDDCLA